MVTLTFVTYYTVFFLLLSACPFVSCPASFDPLCGADGLTHSNLCHLRAKAACGGGRGGEGGLQILRQGPCRCVRRSLAYIFVASS